jgi:hypothetical protein
MGYDISVRDRGTWVNEDQRWIRTGKPRSPATGIVLKRTALTAFETQGYVPSGWPLAYDADGFAVPYLGGVHEVQTITVSATSFTLTFSGQTTGSLTTATTDGADVQAALEALSNIAVGDVSVSGPDTGPYVVTFGGTMADADVAAITGTGTGGAATVTVVETTAGAVDANEVGIGHLFTTVALDANSTGNIPAAVFRDGEVINNFLPSGHSVDAAFRADVKPGGGGDAQITYVTLKI